MLRGATLSGATAQSASSLFAQIHVADLFLGETRVDFEIAQTAAAENCFGDNVSLPEYALLHDRA
ncbi:hypothetical protein DDE84_02285 [Bifidobacterium tibiigranuli]|uniref:Uncharacterized protein n=2 Tax=Bifidobacterium TaxID=1678 RepID=A0A5N6RXW1_9BIFI|nr:hypothetical protein DDF78_08505 [Bifidobacterium tibiigranuli]KAE8129649.1 hypothetical protein DDE84_02285 [Bifidobacterium tibiigranuli]